MSKHEKQVRRERKKTDRARRRARFRISDCGMRNGAAALAAAAVIAAGTQAYAAPVRFDNPAGPGHFDWTSLAGQDVLDVTLDAASQPGDFGPPAPPGAFLRSTYTYGEQVTGGTEAPFINKLQSLYSGYFELLVGVGAGELIPTAGYDFKPTALINNTYPGAPVYSFLPEGQQTYLGIRLDPGDGDHYGWIGVVRTGAEIDPFAWGYETEVGVPIPAGIPEPGSLALLAFGALAVCRRRQA